MGAVPVNGVVWCVHDYAPRDFTHHPRDAARIMPFSESGGNTFVRRIDGLQADAPVFLGEFGASRWPTHDTGDDAADDMFNLLLSGRSGDPAAMDVLRTAWSQNGRRPSGAKLRGRS